MFRFAQHDRTSFNKCIYKKCAFTLAEVLITLVIIGVIAAITIPSLIAKYHDRQLTSQFKKAYSSLSNAINKTNLIDFSGQAECYYGENGLLGNGSGCISFYTTLSKNLSIAKTCKGNAKADGCVPTYSTYHIEDNSGCDGFSENYINNFNTVYVLSDGQIIIRFTNTPVFLNDINGFKGPNKPGYDLFLFYIYKNPQRGMYLKGISGGCSFTETGGRTTAEMMQHAFAGKE